MTEPCEASSSLKLVQLKKRENLPPQIRQFRPDDSLWIFIRLWFPKAFSLERNWEHHNTSNKRRGIMKAIWNGVEIANSDDTIVVEGNHYFPPDAINKSYFKESTTHSTCPWKGEASYYDVAVNGEVNKDAAWYYPEPKPAAAEIKNRIAFWRGVKVEQG